MSKDGRTIREKVLALLRAPDYRPRDRDEIARALGLQGRDRVAVRKTLSELEYAGEPDIFIAAENTGTAMNGDRVVARISHDALTRGAKVRAGQAARNRS